MNISKTKKALLITASVIGAAAILVLAFFAGFWTKGALSNSSFDWAMKIINEYYYKEIDADNAEEVALDAVVAQYLDIYSEYYTAEEYAAQQSTNSGFKSGFGLSCSYIPGMGLTVMSAVGNSPVFASGLRAGDVILSGTVDGVTSQFNSLSDFNEFVSGLGENATVTFNTSENSFTVTKDTYSTSYVLFATNDNAWTFTGDSALEMTESSSDKIEYLHDDTGYISLSQFYGNAPAQFRAAVEKFNEEGCTKLIIDLRSDGGGLVSVMQQIAACFEPCKDGLPAMTAKYRSGAEEVYDIKAASSQPVISEDTEVYILANSGSASASEALIGCLISYGVTDYDNIYISEYSESYLSAVGLTAEEAKSGRTYGKGIMQSTFVNYLTGEALKLTTAQIYWPNGETIHGTGLTSAEGAENRCNAVKAPLPLCGDGEELAAAVSAIYASAQQ